MSQSDFVTRGQSLVTTGQFQEAVKVCRLGLLGRPTTVEGRIVLGQALLGLKRYDEVLAEMRVALELDHSSVIAQTLKCEALLRKGDHQGAIDQLHQLRTQHPGDGRIAQLLDEANRASGRPAKSASHPAVGFVGATADTKNYPRGPEPSKLDPNGDEDSGGGYTRPTSLAAPSAKKRTTSAKAVPNPDATPPPNVLAVGERTGTVEVDPDLDGVEVAGDDDFGAVAAPPPGKRRPANLDEPRGFIERSKAPGKKKPLPKPTSAANPAPLPKKKKIVTTVELDDDELIEVDDPPPVAARAKPGPASRVRSAVNLAAGPLPESPVPRPAGGPQQLANMLAGQPHVMQMQPVPAASPASTRPTQTIEAVGPPLDALFGGQVAPAPAWAKATVAAQMAPQHPDRASDPGMQALLDGLDPNIGAVPVVEPTNSSASRPMKTGIRKGRSRFQIVMWIFIGALVIGGGVFAGFQIRSMRLKKQIEAARLHAVDIAKADTLRGWLGARDSLGGIAQASATIENRAALARTRALLAYEFGVDVAEAKMATDNLGDRGGFDGAIAGAYVALAQNDTKLAKLAVTRAQQLVADDPATLYVTGQLALLDGDVKAALTALSDAASKDNRALYHIGLARAQTSISMWTEALAALDKALAVSSDHPAAMIERAMVLAASGRITAGSTVGSEARRQLDKLVLEAPKPIAEQSIGVSPLQAALANLALAQVDFAMGEREAARTHINIAVNLRLDDQRFAEVASETVIILDDTLADLTAQSALKTWPSSRRAQIVLAQSLIAQGKPGDALDFLMGKGASAMALLKGQAVRAQAKLALDDVDGARTDFDLVLKRAPQLEIAVIGRALVDLATGDAAAARQRIEPRYNPAASSVAMTVAYAAVLRASGDPEMRDKAKALLDKVVPIANGSDVLRAQIELSRVLSDAGDVKSARTAIAEGVKAGNTEARIQDALLLIEDQGPMAGRVALDALLADAGLKPAGFLLVETARARMLVGDHPGATKLLEQADKTMGTVPWRLDREHARLAFRKGDTAAAAQLIERAMETSGPDLETLLIAADIVYVDMQTDRVLAGLTDKLTAALVTRLKGYPEAQIILGKLALAAGKNEEAETQYKLAAAAYEKTKTGSRRRLAQVEFGLAVVALGKEDSPTAKDKLDVVEAKDPSNYDAFLFHSELMLKLNDPQRAFELVKRAVVLNPDLVQAWQLYGVVAKALNNSKALAEAVLHLGEIAPNSDELKELQEAQRGR